MCQCHRSWRKSWSLLLVRSCTTLVQASGDSTGGRAHTEQIVDVPVPQILEQNVEVIKVIPQEQCQRMRFFSCDSVCGGGCGRHVPHVLPHTPGLILSASDGMFVVYLLREHTTIMTALCLCVARRMKAQRHQRALRMGSNDQCDGNQCCPSFGGCPRGHHPGVEPAAQCASTRGNSPGSDIVRIDRLTTLS